MHDACGARSAMPCQEPAQSLSMCAQVQQMIRVATHTAAKTARLCSALARGATKSMVICCLARRVAVAKAASAVLQMLAGQVARFCFVFRALRLASTAFAKQRTRCEDFEQPLRQTCSAWSRDFAYPVRMHRHVPLEKNRSSINCSACKKKLAAPFAESASAW